MEKQLDLNIIKLEQPPKEGDIIPQDFLPLVSFEKKEIKIGDGLVLKIGHVPTSEIQTILMELKEKKLAGLYKTLSKCSLQVNQNVIPLADIDKASSPISQENEAELTEFLLYYFIVLSSKKKYITG